MVCNLASLLTETYSSCRDCFSSAQVETGNWDLGDSWREAYYKDKQSTFLSSSPAFDFEASEFAAFVREIQFDWEGGKMDCCLADYGRE